MNTIFDEINSTVVENLSNHPEAFADTRYLKSNAASIEKGKGQVMVDPCNRTDCTAADTADYKCAESGTSRRISRNRVLQSRA
jgi:hypothetical protein